MANLPSPLSATEVLTNLALANELTSRKSPVLKCLSRSAWFELILLVSIFTSIFDAAIFDSS